MAKRKSSLGEVAADLASLGNIDGIPFVCKPKKGGGFNCRKHTGAKPAGGGKGTKFVYVASSSRQAAGERLGAKSRSNPSGAQTAQQKKFKNVVASCKARLSKNNKGKYIGWKECMTSGLGGPGSSRASGNRRVAATRAGSAAYQTPHQKRFAAAAHACKGLGKGVKGLRACIASKMSR